MCPYLNLGKGPVHWDRKCELHPRKPGPADSPSIPGFPHSMRACQGNVQLTPHSAGCAESPRLLPTDSALCTDSELASEAAYSCLVEFPAQGHRTGRPGLASQAPGSRHQGREAAPSRQWGPPATFLSRKDTFKKHQGQILGFEEAVFWQARPE